MRILWVGDHGQTGFGRVSGELIPRLIAQGIEVVQLGVNYLGDPHSFPWKIYPASTLENPNDPHGFKKIARIAATEQPDKIVLFGDFWICEEYVKALDFWMDRVRKLKGDETIPCPFDISVYSPVDATGYTRQRLEFLEHPAITGIATYTSFGVEEIISALYGKNQENLPQEPKVIWQIPHGADTKTFFPIHREEARVRLGLGEALAGKFVVLNANRNQYRKRIDLTILGFCRFLKESGADAVLWLQMAPHERVGWNTEEVFTRECHRLGIDCESTPRLMYTDPNYNPANPVPVESLNLIYNCADVMINTCSAEGFGLVSFEGSACGIPQIVPDHSCFPEIYGNNAHYIPASIDYVDQGTGLIHAMLDPDNVSCLLREAHIRFTKGITSKGVAPMLARVKSEEYDWDRIALKFHALLHEGAKK